MIIAQTPFRITLGGGGTDLPSFYKKERGFLVTSAINKYVYITVNRRTIDNLIWLSYSKIEQIKAIDQIKHELIRESLRLLNIQDSIEIHSITEVSSGTGLGSSSSFTVGLLNALHIFKKEHMPTISIAEEACHIEIDVLKKPIGKQDQYIAAFGGIICLEIDYDGTVKVIPLNIHSDTIENLERNTLIFYTGINRDSSYVLAEQSQAAGDDKSKVTKCLRNIKQIGIEIKNVLESGDTKGYGRLLNEHWKVKKEMSKKISLGWIDELYEVALRNNCLGGKLIGAGGGGFLMLYSEDNKVYIRKICREKRLKEVRFRFDFGGSKVIANFF